MAVYKGVDKILYRRPVMPRPVRVGADENGVAKMFAPLLVMNVDAMFVWTHYDCHPTSRRAS